MAAISFNDSNDDAPLHIGQCHVQQEHRWGGVADILFRDLDRLLRDAGKDGGRLGPSVYDTAMVARLAPPVGGPNPALEWLLSQQQLDGGWGSPVFPAGRHLPTLAAVLALRTRNDTRARESCAAGLDFLRTQSKDWETIPDDLPIALELTFPALLADAIRQGVDIAHEPYDQLAQIGRHKRSRIATMPSLRGTPAAYAWEGHGTGLSTELVDAAGSVGGSPSATAAWMAATVGDPRMMRERRAAAEYLRRAADSTGCGVPGVLPHAYPVERFEQTWVMFSVLSAGLFSRSEIRASLSAKLDELAAGARPDGIGYSDVFASDGDDTSCFVAVLREGGRKVDAELVRRFEGKEFFFTYVGERNPSVSTNAHALFALSLFNQDSPRARQFLAGRQRGGRFLEDKWHTSWFYTTHRAILALGHPDHAQSLDRALGALLTHQHEDGGFGSTPRSSCLETAHAYLALRALRNKGLGGEGLRRSMARASKWMLSKYRPFGPDHEPLWIGKELYAAPRVDRATELSALLAAVLERDE